LIEFFAAKLVNVEYDKIFMLESRGFLLGVPLSLRVNKPSYPCRKKGKLPGDVIAYTYDLEYGTDSIEIQK
jgi:adenine phosphoribosyltransferase